MIILITFKKRQRFQGLDALKMLIPFEDDHAMRAAPAAGRSAP